jgi:hypothetical protein
LSTGRGRAVSFGPPMGENSRVNEDNLARRMTAVEAGMQHIGRLLEKPTAGPGVSAPAN